MPNIASASFISLLEQCSGSCESRSADVDSDATYQHVLNTIASYVILTLSFYALMVSCVIGAIEGIKIITYNIPGTFLQDNWPNDQDRYNTFECMMNGITCEINPKYAKYVSAAKDGRKLVYGKISDFLTEPLHGSLFRQHRNSIIELGISFDTNRITRKRNEHPKANPNFTSICILGDGMPSPRIQECVGTKLVPAFILSWSLLRPPLLALRCGLKCN